MQSRAPTMKDLTNKSALWSLCAEQPDVLEFVDGASDVPLINVSFLPWLQQNSIKQLSSRRPSKTTI